jgi:hypothetical protein
LLSVVFCYRDLKIDYIYGLDTGPNVVPAIPTNISLTVSKFCYEPNLFSCHCICFRRDVTFHMALSRSESSQPHLRNYLIGAVKFKMVMVTEYIKET